MSYLVNGARPVSLTINGQEYADRLVSLQVSDTSAFKSGLVSTSGILVLGNTVGSVRISDYDRNNFRRGSVVILDIALPDGEVTRHPRGYLYVLSQVFDVSDDSITLEVGCQLALAALTNDVSSLLPLAPIPLDPVREDISNISASFASAAQYLYQDNQGALVSGLWFESDTLTESATPDFISFLGLSF